MFLYFPWNFQGSMMGLLWLERWMKSHKLVKTQRQICFCSGKFSWREISLLFGIGRAFERILTIAMISYDIRRLDLRKVIRLAPKPFGSLFPACPALSFTVQSIVTFCRTVLISSRAIVRRVSSPRTFTALSFVSKAS
jgi:hypothetical protein